MYSARDSAALPALGFPIRESTGQRSFNTSPWLIAVVHALLRLLEPRHPPCALIILTVIRPEANVRSGDTRIDLASCAVFKIRREGAKPRWHLRPNRRRRRGRSLNTQQLVIATAVKRSTVGQ